jgi:hypothetical protein
MKTLQEFTRAADLAFAIRFLRLLTMDWKKTGAYREKLIDQNGKVLKKPETNKEKDVYTVFHKLAFNLKRLLNKLPFGKLTISSYLAGLWLIKDHTQMSDDDLQKVLKEVTGIDLENCLVENDICINKITSLKSGSYTLNKNLLLPINGDELVLKGTQITTEDVEPIGTILGYPVFEVYHPNTKNRIYVTQEDLEDA